MKKIVIIFFVASILLSGCVSDEYTFPNKGQPIEEIELLYNPHAYNGNIGGPMDHILTLEGENVDAFMEDLYNLETYRCNTPPPTGYGFHVVRVAYENGDVEMFGSWHIEFIANGETPKLIGSYAFNTDEFENLFAQYEGQGDGSGGQKTRGQGDGSAVPFS